MLTDRQLLILSKIVESYTQTGEPVGSQKLVKDGQIDASSATVRNEMSRLEDLGYLEKMHTSSGRIPSREGFRFYVENLLQPEAPSAEEKRTINRAFDTQLYDQELQKILNQSVNMLSKLTNHTAIILGPRAQFSQMTQLELVRIASDKLLVVMEFDDVYLKSKVFTCPQTLSEHQLRQLSSLLKNQLLNLTIKEALRELDEKLPYLLHRILLDDVRAHTLQMIRNIIEEHQSEKIFISGKSHLLHLMEQMTPKDVQLLYDILEEDGQLSNLLSQNLPSAGEYTIEIGQNIADHEFDELSLLTMNYQLNDQYGGQIAIIGPMRMSYAPTIGMMDYFREELLKHLMEDFLKP